MRRREKFIIVSAILSGLLLAVLLTPIIYRLLAVVGFGFITYLVASWALSDDLARHERLTIVPFPAFYAAAVSLFYVVLPENWISRAAVLLLFGLGMYAIFLTTNILSVAKGRTIQLLYAAHASQLFFTLLISLLLTNSVFSFHLPAFWTVLLVGLLHFPLIYMSLWATKLSAGFEPEELQLSLLLTIMLMSLTVGLCFFPLSIWQYALLIMSLLYMGLGIFQNHLRGRLFPRTVREYGAVAAFTIIMFLLMMPLK